MSEEKGISAEKGCWADAVLYAIAFFLLFWALGSGGLWAAEGRWAEVTREMFLTRDFFHPSIGGEPYFDKPLLTYWLIAAISAISGVLNEWVVRLPSAMAGVLAVWATKNIGTRLWSAQVGRVAGWMLLSLYAFLFWARTGTAEAENLAAIVLAVAWYWARRDRPGFITFFVFYAIIFIGALTKGLTAVVVPVLVVLPDVLRGGRWRGFVRPSHFLAVILGGALYLAPFYVASVTRPASYGETGLGLVFQENILRYFKAFDHKGPVYLYLYGVPLLLMPWTPLWIAATAGAIKIRKSLDDKTRWLLWAMALIFLFFTLSGSRRSYYILPIVPFCVLLTAVFAMDMRDQRLEWFRRWGVVIQDKLLLVLIAAELISPLVMVILQHTKGIAFPPAMYAAGIVVGISAAVLRQVIYRRGGSVALESGEARTTASLISIAVVIFGGYFCWQKSILNTYRTERPFVEQVKARTAETPAAGIGIFPKVDATFLFYLDRKEPVKGLENAAALREFLANEQSQVLICRQRYVPGVLSTVSGDFPKGQDLMEEVRPWESKSDRKEKWGAWLLKRPADRKTLFLEGKE